MIQFISLSAWHHIQAVKNGGPSTLGVKYHEIQRAYMAGELTADQRVARLEAVFGEPR